MAEKGTIEIISRHVGHVRMKTKKGEPRRIYFEEARDGVGVALVDHDVAEVLLGTPELKNDFWKEGASLEEEPSLQEEKKDEKKEKKEETPSLPTGPMKATELIELIKKAATAEEVDALVGTDTRATVLSNADVRKAEIAEASEKKD